MLFFGLRIERRFGLAMGDGWGLVLGYQHLISDGERYGRSLGMEVQARGTGFVFPPRFNMKFMFVRLIKSIHFRTTPLIIIYAFLVSP